MGYKIVKEPCYRPCAYGFNSLDGPIGVRSVFVEYYRVVMPNSNDVLTNILHSRVLRTPYRRQFYLDGGASQREFERELDCLKQPEKYDYRDELGYQEQLLREMWEKEPC